ncbi:ABC transporter permease subunit [Microbacterium sp.]|uniref:ABC transporter permease subunit n=1 Tax=Microbacterium sp. TaxID=51671 RepID=UPI0039E2B680
MTAPAAPATAAAAPQTRYRVSFAHLIGSEWIKVRSLRSTWWSIALVAVVSIGLSLLMASAMAAYTDASATAGTTVAQTNPLAVQAIVFSTVLTQLLAVIVGTITVTGEYSTGMIRSTLTAAPGRIGALLAKALVVGVLLFVTSLVVFVTAWGVTSAILPYPLDVSDPDTSLMPLLGAVGYLALVAIMGVGLGFIIRNGPGALSIGIGLLFVAPIIVGFFPRTDQFAWLHDAASYLPSNAGQSLFFGSGMSGNPLETAPAIVTLLAWTVVFIGGGIAMLKTRDA